ncbi:uncharacterized protein LOC114220473 [Eumetopias jubatus]|uniref:uncharacterized protein LOC114220473 n=1 Tax=Eumetopias jubatus TaxID=34886 RepID=UPI001016F235|nr:uncharacterized protein LOC114220473 [Eumetopias jubatus]
MFTHQTPEPRYLLDPQGASPHLREQTTPRQQALRTQDPAPHTPSPNSSAQPLHQQSRSRGGGTQTVNRNAEATARLLRVSMPPLLPLPNSGTVSDSAPCARSVGRGGGERSCPPPFCLWAAARCCLFHRGLKISNWRQRGGQNLRLFHNRCIQQFTEVWPSALGELGLGVTRRPLGAEEAPVRRLRAPDKSGAGASSAVSMEERETEEVGGRSSRKSTATVSAAFLPPCIGRPGTLGKPSGERQRRSVQPISA